MRLKEVTLVTSLNKGFAALCAWGPPKAVPATLAPRKEFFPGICPGKNDFTLFYRLRAVKLCEAFWNNTIRIRKGKTTMRAVVTRVRSASVSIDGAVAGQIGRGFLVLLGVGPRDTEDTAVKLADKICNLRVFRDENDKMNRNLEQVGGSLLVVSQFTLYADTSSRRPGFTGAAKPDLAIPLYERFMARCRERGFDVQHGEFGADMLVASENEGPVTILFDTEEK